MENLAKQTDITGMQSAGRVLPLWKGEYNSSAFYEQTDIVLYNNSSYIARQDTIGNPPPESSLNANDYWQLVAKGIIDADISDATVEFTQAATRENIQSGEDGKTLFGKISKFFADLKPVAFSGKYLDLSGTPGVVSKTANGLAPQLPNETTTTKYLRQDGTWQVPPDTNTQTLTGVKGNAESAYRTGNVNLTPANIGAVATSKVLTTKEQINANTDTSNVAGATAVKAMVAEINSNLPNLGRISLTLTENAVGYGSSVPEVDCITYGNLCLINFRFGIKDGLGEWQSKNMATGAPMPYGSSVAYSCSPTAADGNGNAPRVSVDYNNNLIVVGGASAFTGNIWLTGSLIYFFLLM